MMYAVTQGCRLGWPIELEYGRHIARRRPRRRRLRMHLPAIHAASHVYGCRWFWSYSYGGTSGYRSQSADTFYTCLQTIGISRSFVSSMTSCNTQFSQNILKYCTWFIDMVIHSRIEISFWKSMVPVLILVFGKTAIKTISNLASCLPLNVISPSFKINDRFIVDNFNIVSLFLYCRYEGSGKILTC